jgi:hypothetical protein
MSDIPPIGPDPVSIPGQDAPMQDPPVELPDPSPGEDVPPASPDLPFAPGADPSI